jgi:hypothetical protein
MNNKRKMKKKKKETQGQRGRPRGGRGSREAASCHFHGSPLARWPAWEEEAELREPVACGFMGRWDGPEKLLTKLAEDEGQPKPGRAESDTKSW